MDTLVQVSERLTAFFLDIFHRNLFLVHVILHLLPVIIYCNMYDGENRRLICFPGVLFPFGAIKMFKPLCCTWEEMEGVE